jgi:transposase-like protein
MARSSRIVQEYLVGVVSAQELARREGLERGQIYKWRVQLERRERLSHIETLVETEGVSIEQAHRILNSKRNWPPPSRSLPRRCWSVTF